MPDPVRHLGGDRDGNPHVTPEVTLRVLEMQHDRGLRNLIAAVEEVAEELSTSERIQDISAELRASLDEDRRLLPSVWARFSRLNAGEPYRLKCAYIHQRLINTRQRILEGSRHEPGLDYRSPSELLAELELMRDSLMAHNGQLIAEGVLARLIRNVVTFGFHLATMDVREHARRHEEAVTALYARLGVDYGSLPPKERTELLARELEGLRPLSSLPPPMSGVGHARDLPGHPPGPRAPAST